IDLPQADPDGAAAEVADLIGDDAENVLRISAKTGQGVDAVLDAIIARIPAPGGELDAPPRALIFDSSYDQYRGVVAFVRVVDGVFRPREHLRAMALGTRFEAQEIGYMSPAMRPVQELQAGALGFGFRCGFLGLLHMEIVRERLEREFDLDLLVTAPNVAYRVKPLNEDWVEVHTPADLPDAFDEVEEPYIKASIIVPKEFVGQVMELNNDRRGKFDHLEYLSEQRVHLTYELPLAE